jgi:hypothetical protein
MITLKQDLSAQAERSKERFGPERFAIMEAENAVLAATFEAQPGLGVGDQAPGFMLPDALGGPNLSIRSPIQGSGRAQLISRRLVSVLQYRIACVSGGAAKDE